MKNKAQALKRTIVTGLLIGDNRGLFQQGVRGHQWAGPSLHGMMLS
jgi:hypothetical protein